MYKLNECPTAHVIYGIWNVVNVVRHYLVMETLKNVQLLMYKLK